MSALERFVPIVHIVAAVFAIIELGLTAYVVSAFDGPFFSGSPGEVDFMVFNSVWSLLVLAYLGITPRYMAKLFHHLVAVVLVIITAIFWFAGSIALAVLVGGGGSCYGNRVCGTARAAVAFGFFLWALFTFLAVVGALEFMRSRRHGTTAHGPGVAA